MTLTSACADFVVDLGFEDIPTEAIGWAKSGIFDVAGVTFAAADSEVAAGLAGYRDRIGGPAGETVFGFDVGDVPAPELALFLGTLGHALDFDDVGGFGHPSTVLAPVVFALAREQIVSGADALLAYTAGFEVGTRVADRNLFGQIDTSSHRRGHHLTSVFGCVAAAATAAKLLGLSRNQTQSALGIAASEECGLLRNFGTMTKPLHAGIAARAGILAAYLAASGFDADGDALSASSAFLAVFNPPLDGDPIRQRELADSLGSSFDLERGVALKRFPACWSSHRAVTSILEMLGEAPIPSEEITSIEVDLRNPPLLRTSPVTPLEGKFSMAYNLAATLYRGGLPVIDDYTYEHLANPEMQRLMPLVTHRPDVPEEDVRVRIHLRDGSARENVVRQSLGDPRHGNSAEFVAGKFVVCAGRVLPEDAVSALAATFKALEVCPDLGAAVCPPAPRATRSQEVWTK